MHLSQYLKGISDYSLKNSISETCQDVLQKIQGVFNYKNHINGLMLGNVQSGKTAQTLGIIANLADQEFQIFLLLTTDNVYLYQQTYSRAYESLDTFDVLSEHEDVRFVSSDLHKPLLIVLKKNTNVLRRWRNLISSSSYCKGRPLIIIDDEADAASLNTLVNRRRVSAINNHLASIKGLASSSIYLQVTATPQAIILQAEISGFRPSFVTYFKPGSNYLGGDFVYSEPTSFCIKLTEENELDIAKQESEFIPQGLRDSVMSFLVVCAEFASKNLSNCNFLIHPSVRIVDHESFANKIGEHLNFLLAESEDKEFEDNLYGAWGELQSSKPDITNFEDIKSIVLSLLFEQKFNILILNSKSDACINYKEGYNILIGGNSLGRGITVPRLQIVYYCRKSKSPQADTYWQHSRMFGYDRNANLMRIFLPGSLHRLFTELSNSNRVLIRQIEEYGLEGLQLIYPMNIRPTRLNVLNRDYLNFLTGGINSFPRNPLDSNTIQIDELLSGFQEENEIETSSFEFLIQLLALLGSSEPNDWNNTKFLNCVQALSMKRPSTECILIIRRGRNISKGTGTLLSPNDRIIGERLSKSIILTLYRVNGNKENGWNGQPLWIPNIKFPKDVCFYDTSK